MHAWGSAPPRRRGLRRLAPGPRARRGGVHAVGVAGEVGLLPLLACFGLLDDAAPLFADAAGVPGAGVLFALPALCASGIFRLAHKLYGDIGPAFYGLRTTLVTLRFMALWRLKRPEALKEHDPATLGRVLGLDRAPEVKTSRRKLSRLASCQQATRLGEELARLRVAERGRLMGFLYLDGHVRVYHGQRAIPKAHVARMRLSLPATTDYWINDRSGDPLFVMTAAANAGMVKMLPTVLAEVRRLVGQRRVTIVFDRGGWSPKLFQQLLAARFDLLTYRKGKARQIGAPRFVHRKAMLDGRRVEYDLHDQAVRFLQGKLRLRQVTRLCADGHQTRGPHQPHPHGRLPGRERPARATPAALRPRDDEGRTLLHELFHAAADLRVSGTELVVTLRPLSVPHRTLAVRALCATLNESATLFPGSRLTLRFAVQDAPTIGLAFPGPRQQPAASTLRA
jgi:prepilin-type processing-associated H-X9-DG protein